MNTNGFIEIESSFKRMVVWYFRKNIDKLAHHHIFLEHIKGELIDKLRERVRIHPIKYGLKLESTYHVPNVENSARDRAFKISARALFEFSNIEDMIEEDFSTILAEEAAYEGKGSGLTLAHVDGMLLTVTEYTPLGGSAYIPLPKNIQAKKAVVNPENYNDNMCFKWSILAKHVINNNRGRVDMNYTNEEYRYDFSALSFPTPVSEISLFERLNPGTSVNIYVLHINNNNNNNNQTNSNIYPLRVSNEMKADHFDLLLISRYEQSHYTYISNFSRLVSIQINKHGHSLFICRSCFTSFDAQPLKNKLYGAEALAQHNLFCGPNKPIFPELPKKGATLQFKSWGKTQRMPFVLYADFEALLLKTSEQHGYNTKAIHSHHPMSYGFTVVTAEGVPVELLDRFDIPRHPVIFRGSESSDDVAKRFVLAMANITEKIYTLLKTTNVDIIISTEEIRAHDLKSVCDLCKKSFIGSNVKVRHHDHLSGRFLNTLCNQCNLELRTQKYVPCFLHNLSNYDAHFIIRELGYDTQRISVIPNSEEKFVSFSKYINNEFSIRYIDTFRFIASSLATLAKNILTPDFGNFRETVKVFSSLNDEMSLVTRKGVYPYEYTDGWAKLLEVVLPEKQKFYNTLNETHVSDADYEHAFAVWKHFQCRTLGDYSDLYLKIDVLLLADVFENFRDLCISTYAIDPAHFITSPGLSFQSMLKYTSTKLQLLDDYEQILFVEAGIRGGLVQATTRYVKANNFKTPGYRADEPDSWIVYQDCTRLLFYFLLFISYFT